MASKKTIYLVGQLQYHFQSLPRHNKAKCANGMSATAEQLNIEQAFVGLDDRTPHIMMIMII